MDEPAARPKRVIVLDAQDPRVEVHGVFYWAEDHDRIVAEQTAQAHQAGYAAGWHDAHTRPAIVSFRNRRPPWRWALRRARRLFFLLCLLVITAVVVGSWLTALAANLQP